MQKRSQVTRMSHWNPNGKGMLVWESKGGVRPTLHSISAPGQEFLPILGFPSTALHIEANPNPEEHELIYTSDQDGNEQWQVYRFDLENGKSERLTDGQHRFEWPTFDRSGQQIAYLKIAQDRKNRELFLMNQQTVESAKKILDLEGTWILADWSPNGQHLLAARYVSVNEMYPYVIDLKEKRLQSIGPANDTPISYGAAVWNKDGSRVFYSSDEGSEFKHLRLREISTGEDIVLTEDIPWNVSELSLSSDGQWLAFVVSAAAMEALYWMNTETFEIQSFGQLPMGAVANISFHPHHNTIAFSHTSSSGSTDLYSYELETGTLQQWTAQLANRSTHQPMAELIHFPTFDHDHTEGRQREIPAFYHRPSTEFAPPYPVLISVHGGPESQAGIINGPITELLHNQGMAILTPNIRGSTGYGKTYTQLDNDTLREHAVKDIGALLDWIGDQPELNAEQVVIVGGSYGGYMVLASSVHYSDRLLCGIDLYGMSNLVSFLENTESYRRDARREEYGDEREPNMKRFMEEISPLHHTEEINIPLLVYQGANDPRVPPSESRQLVEKLRKEEKEVWYLEAANEGHGLRKPVNQLFVRATCLEFVKRHLAHKTD